jgi:hypothetical protein
MALIEDYALPRLERPQAEPVLAAPAFEQAPREQLLRQCTVALAIPVRRTSSDSDTVSSSTSNASRMTLALPSTLLVPSSGSPGGDASGVLEN